MFSLLFTGSLGSSVSFSASQRISPLLLTARFPATPAAACCLSLSAGRAALPPKRISDIIKTINSDFKGTLVTIL